MNTLTNTNYKENQILEKFFNNSVIEAQALRSKLRSGIEDLAKYGNSNKLNDAIEVFDELRPAFNVIDSYFNLINTLLKNVDVNRPKFYNAFFPTKVKEERELILQLYPQSMPLSHYVELFDLCGYAPNVDFEKVTQITIKRLYSYQKFQLINKEIEIQDVYSFGELSGVIRSEKIDEIISDFWDEGNLSSLEFLALEKGGKLISNENKLKVFEIKSKEKDVNGNQVYNLVYVTPSFYSFQPEDVYNQKKGEYFFLNKEPRIATSIVEVEKTLFRHHFVKPVGDSSDMRFNVKINMAINMFRFKVTKVQKDEE